MSTFKKCKVVMLPTKKASHIYKDNNKNTLGYVTGANPGDLEQFPNQTGTTNQHLYILSDEEIKEGDWCIMLDSFGNVFSNPQQYLGESKGHYLNKGLRKIIATTDKSLVTDKGNAYYPYGIPLPQPSQPFIEKFVEEYNKGNIITDIMVEYESCKQPESCNNSLTKKCICPKGLKINPRDNTITIRKVKDNWNREELNHVIEFIKKIAHDDLDTVSPGIKEEAKQKLKWIENNL